MSLKSPYERDFYKPNPEIPHIVIAGEVQINALKTFAEELFHPDHGNCERNAILLQDIAPNT